MSKIEFRLCIPKDVDQAVPLILESGPESFSYVFKNKKREAIDFLNHAFQRKGGEFSFDNHYALLIDEKLIGIGPIFSEKRAKGFMLKDFLNIMRFYQFNAIAILINGLRIEQILKLPKKIRYV